MRNQLVVLDDEGLAVVDRRQHDERRPRYRTEAGRDRDRVLYASAFHRLGHVTQVTASETGLSFHSRLTHSLKVAQFARRLAEQLLRRDHSGAAGRVVEALSPDAAEAAALAHDLGHPPFGHLAEEELNDVAGKFGGFEGNAQSFRILTRLALRWPAHPGLDLTRRTLNGVLKYPWSLDPDDPKKRTKWNHYHADRDSFVWVRENLNTELRTVEAEIMDWADDVTYAIHDMDDFYRAGLVPLDRLCQHQPELERFQAHLDQAGAEKGRAGAWVRSAELLFRSVLDFDGPYTGSREERISLRMSGSGLITRYIDAPHVINDTTGAAFFVIDEPLRDQIDVLKQLIWYYVIERPSLALIQAGQRRVIRGLFEMYEDAAVRQKKTNIFPPLVAERLEETLTEDAKRRVVVDYIASLTEDGALGIYRRLTGVASGSIVDPAGRLL